MLSRDIYLILITSDEWNFFEKFFRQHIWQGIGYGLFWGYILHGPWKESTQLWIELYELYTVQFKCLKY